LNSSRNNNLTPNNYTTKESNLRSNSLKNKKLSSNILDQSIIIPSIYSDKYYFKYGTKINDNLLKFRENTSKKYKARIKKEIDYLSNSFKNPISKFTYTKNNKSIVNNFDNFPLTYTTTVSSLKKYNRDKKYDIRYQMLPNKNQNDDEISLLYKQIREKQNNRKSNF
jgi:hypothetical protein